MYTLLLVHTPLATIMHPNTEPGICLRLTFTDARGIHNKTRWKESEEVVFVWRKRVDPLVSRDRQDDLPAMIHAIRGNRASLPFGARQKFSQS